MTARNGGSTLTEDVRPQRLTVAWAGWHPDPFDLAAERWWDGTKWTGHVRGAPTAGAAAVAAAQLEAVTPEQLRGMPPGWYLWRGQVARWWDGAEWGSARRPFADHVRRPTPEKLRRPSRARPAYGVAAVALAAVAAIVLWVALDTGSRTISSSTVGYQASVARLCRRLFAQERGEIRRGGTAAILGNDPRPQAVVVGELLRAVAHDTGVFDEKLRVLVAPPGLRAARRQYLSLESQNSAIYALVIPRVEGRGGLPALTTVTSLLSRNAQALQTLLTRLGGTACSLDPLA